MPSSLSLSLWALALATADAAFRFVPATDPAVWWSGRSKANGDGSVTFDWESAAAHLNIQASSVRAILTTSNGVSTRMVTSTSPVGTFSWSPFTAVLVPPSSAPGSPANVTVAFGLTDQVYTVRIMNDLEPAFIGKQGDVSLLGFEVVDGTVLAPGPVQTRSIEFVGDSITAGYGSIGRGPCNATDGTSSYYNSWSRITGDNLKAVFSTVAWSGKGVYKNCCDQGETMPSYWLQTFGSDSFTRDWNFSSFVPDAVVIGLGTNDFYSYPQNPQQWTAGFTSAYLSFLSNITAAYQRPQMPFFLAQGPMNNNGTLTSILGNIIQQWNGSGGKATFLDVRNLPTDGCGGHPGVLGHPAMAAKAVSVISAAMGWQ